MKTAIFAAATVIEVVAWAAIAGSLFLLFDGWAAWLIVTTVFVGFVFGWGAALVPHARWPLPAAWCVACKSLTYFFAAQVLWFVSVWAGLAFVVAVAVVEFLQLAISKRRTPQAAGRRTVSLGAGRGA